MAPRREWREAHGRDLWKYRGLTGRTASSSPGPSVLGYGVEWLHMSAEPDEPFAAYAESAFEVPREVD